MPGGEGQVTMFGRGPTEHCEQKENTIGGACGKNTDENPQSVLLHAGPALPKQDPIRLAGTRGVQDPETNSQAPLQADLRPEPADLVIQNNGKQRKRKDRNYHPGDARVLASFFRITLVGL